MRVHYVNLEITCNKNITDSFTTGNILDYFFQIYNIMLKTFEVTLYMNFSWECEIFFKLKIAIIIKNSWTKPKGVGLRVEGGGG